MWLPFAKTYTIMCGDEKKTLYKNPDDAFPLYVKTTDASARVDAKVQNQASATVAAELKPHVDALLFEVDEQNRSLMMSFRAAYVNYQSHPCSGQAQFDRTVDSLIQRQQRLAEARLSIRGLIALASCVDDRSRFLQTYQRIVDTVGGAPVGHAVVLEIEDGRTAALEWTGEEDG